MNSGVIIIGATLLLLWIVLPLVELFESIRKHGK